jgi:hypothetical protein
MSRNALPRSAGKNSSGWIFSPRPVASAGRPWRKNGTSEPSAAASSFRVLRGQRPAEQFVQREQRGRGIAAAAAQAGGERDFFLQMDMRTPRKFAPAKTGGRAVNQIFGIHRQHRRCRTVRPRFRALERQPVAKVDRLHDGFEFVKAVGRLPRMFSSRLTLQGDDFSSGMGFTKSKTRQRKIAGALSD